MPNRIPATIEPLDVLAKYVDRIAIAAEFSAVNPYPDMLDEIVALRRHIMGHTAPIITGASPVADVARTIERYCARLSLEGDTVFLTYLDSLDEQTLQPFAQLLSEHSQALGFLIDQFHREFVKRTLQSIETALEARLKQNSESN